MSHGPRKKLTKEEQDKKNAIFQNWKSLVTTLTTTLEEYKANANETALNKTQIAYHNLANAIKQAGEIPSFFYDAAASNQVKYNEVMRKNGLQQEYRLLNKTRERKFAKIKKSKTGWIIGGTILIVFVCWYILQSNLADEKNHLVDLAKEAVQERYPDAKISVDQSDVTISRGIETISDLGHDHAEVEVIVENSEDKDSYMYVWLDKGKDAGIGSWKVSEIR